jgi:hypothetical protein
MSIRKLRKLTRTVKSVDSWSKLENINIKLLVKFKCTYTENRNRWNYNVYIVIGSVGTDGTNVKIRQCGQLEQTELSRIYSSAVGRNRRNYHEDITCGRVAGNSKESQTVSMKSDRRHAGCEVVEFIGTDISSKPRNNWRRVISWKSV